MVIAIRNYIIFYRQDFVVKNPFIQAINNNFGAQVQSLDFASPAALNTINNRASDNTNGKIPEVFDEISAHAVMFLMNALYFKGNWTNKFDKSETANSTFHSDDGTTKEVSTMNHDNLGAIFYTGQHFYALELPHGRRNFSMIIMLPISGFNNFYQNFTPEVWEEMTTALNYAAGWTSFAVSMP